MKKKEAYKHILPHFQLPGQAYFITWSLKDAIPPKALNRYSLKLEMLKSQMKDLDDASSNATNIDKLKQEYYSERKKYIKAFDDLMDADRNPTVDLSKPVNRDIIIQSLQFWEGQRLINIAYAIMPNHVHWVLELSNEDEKGNPVYLQDIMQSIKRYIANKINKAENRTGTLWQKESFDTTIRDEKHLYHAINYTLNNPVKAGLVKDWHNWPGTWNGYLDLE